MTVTTNPRSIFKTPPPLIVINKQVERPLTEHTATLDIQVSKTEMLRLYVDDDLLEQGIENSMEEGSSLEEVKDIMLDYMMQFEMRNRRLHGPFDYQFEHEIIFDHNRWKQSILLAAEHRWQDDRLTDGKPLRVFSPLKVRAVAFRTVESIAGRYRVIADFEKNPAYSDKTMEEFLKLSIQRQQRELNCAAAGKWNLVDRLAR